MTENRSIVEVINDYLTSGNPGAPIFHVVALKLQQVLARQDYSIDEVNQLITSDPGLAGQVLRVSNSAFYAGLTKVTTIHEAIVRLGAREVANITMLATQQDLYRSTDPQFNAIMQTLWRHALCCAIGTRWLAGKTGYVTLAQEAFLAGLLHDIGKLFLLRILEEISRTGKSGGVISPALLVEVFGSMHAEHGYQIMQRWNMPETYCDVVHSHHTEQWDQGNTLLTLVRLVDQACNKVGVGMRPDPGLVLFAAAEAQVLGVKEITLAELEIVIEDALVQVLSGNK
jgi:HD-like signal output (HDOD) protein